MSLLSCSSFYVETEDIRVQSNGAMISGTISFPKDFNNPFPLLIIVHGSGTGTREKYRYFQKLCAEGFAVLRYDKRGTGDSEGTYEGVSIENSKVLLNTLAEDAVAFSKALKNHPLIDKENIGYIGISQGGWIIPIAASLDSSAKFIVSISGTPATIGHEFIYSQLTKDDVKGYNYDDIELINQKVDEYNGPFGFDSRPILEQLSIPSFWIIGEKDESIPVEKSIMILDNLREKNPQFINYKVIKNANHSLKNIDTDEPFQVIKPIANWINKNISRDK